MNFTPRTIILLIILLIAISIFAVLIWYPLGFVLNEGFLRGIFGGFGDSMAAILLIAYVAIICIGTWILLLLYILYKLIDPLFIINIPIFGQIIAAILLDITPFKEVRETGVVNFFDTIFDLSGDNIFRRFFDAVINFLLSSGTTAKNELFGDVEQKAKQKFEEKTQNITNPKETESTEDNNTGQMTVFASELSSIEDNNAKLYITTSYNNCISNIKPISSTVSGIERVKLQINNTKAKMYCDKDKISLISNQIGEEIEAKIKD
uniref:Uncharacterized protein n=1 Tax=viral metagenome TaxID=1070528 RepID=A0A6C0CUC8_9ZZZZ